MSNVRQKYGMTIDSFLGDTNAAGALQAPSVGGVLQSNDITGIGDNAWSKSFTKANITGLSLPNLTSIGNDGIKEAFDGNQFFKTLNLPNLTTVNARGMYYAFQNSGLTSITGLSRLTSVEESGMAYCFNGTQISGDIDLSSLTTIGSDGLSLCFFGTRIASVDLSKLTTVWGGALTNAFAYSTVSSIDFSGMVNMITQSGQGNSDYMCQNCTSLTSVDFSNLVTATGFHHCFEGCSSLVEIDFPKLTTIGQPNESWGELLAYMFSECSSLKIVRFPKLSTIIGSNSDSNNWNYTFYGCTALETVDFSNATAVVPCTWNHDDSNAMPFRNTNNTYKILVPNGLYDQWIAADGWSDSEIRPHIERATKATVFIANEAGTIALVKNVPSSQATADLEYSTDLGATWNTYTVGTSLTFNARFDQIWFRAGTTGNPNGLSAFHFTGTGTWVCASDLGFLIARNGIAASTQLPQNCFGGLFKNCTSLIGVSSDALPFTRLSSGCYVSMFEGCTNLHTNAPDLPATNVPDLAYRYMFKGCSRLATPPKIEGTTFGTQSCDYMCQNCTSLATMPQLKATNLAAAGKYYCFQNMFDGCTSLTSAALPATTVGNGCYRYMFHNCSNLNDISLGYKGNFNSAFENWVDGVAASGTLQYNGTDTTVGVSAIPSGWTVVSINYIYGLETNGAKFSTGHIPTADMKVTGIFKGTAGGDNMIGSDTDDGSSAQWRMFDANGSFYLSIAGIGYRIEQSGWDSTKWYSVEAGNYYFECIPEDGGTTLSASTQRTQLDPSATPLFFGEYPHNFGCRRFTVYEGQTLVADYRPAKDSNGMVCFYDEVSETFCYFTDGTPTEIVQQ